jgi:hypothetical protein
MNEKAQLKAALKDIEIHSPSTLLVKSHYLKITYNLPKSLHK